MTTQDENQTRQVGEDQHPIESSATVAIVDALAAHGDEESALPDHYSLYDYIDSDALDELIQNTPPSTQLHVEFQIEDMTVRISSDATVRID